MKITLLTFLAFSFFTLNVFSQTSRIQTNSFGGFGLYSPSGYGLGFQYNHQGEGRLGLISKLSDNWGNKNEIAYQSYEIEAGVTYTIVNLGENMKLNVGSLPVLSYHRQADEDDNALYAINYGLKGMASLQINAENNSTVSVFLNKGVYGKDVTAAGDFRIGVAYSFY